VRLADLFVRTAILDGAASASEAVARALVHLAETGAAPLSSVPEVLHAIRRREALGSTGIGRGVALPHARTAAVSRPVAILASCRPPIDFDSIDGEPVDLVALCLSPQEGYRALDFEPLLRSFRHDAYFAALRAAATEQELRDALAAEDAALWGGRPAPRPLPPIDPGLAVAVTARRASFFAAACGQPAATAPDAVATVGRTLAAGVGLASAELAAMLRDIFGEGPTPAIDPAWLTWNAGTIPRMARGIETAGDFAALPVLADALEDAGCAEATLLGHLRASGPHVRGCWAVDLLQGEPPR